ncbi:MAG: urea ABC transporter permease subunit UrtB [Pseudomonadota bacterium]|nr:urea ABC transporter permease subunit UrtB [Pseudomonadota bacterium]
MGSLIHVGRSVRCFLAVLLVMLGMSGPPSVAASERDVSLAEQLAELNTRSFAAKARVIESLAQSPDRRVLPLFKQLLDGDLYYAKPFDAVVLVTPVSDGYSVADVLSGEALGVVGKRAVKRISINNTIRGLLKMQIATLSLSDPEPDVRSAAVKELTGQAEPEIIQLFVERLAVESDQGVKRQLAVALALNDLSHGDRAVRLAAIDIVAGSLLPVVANRLRAMTETDSDGHFGESDTEVRASAAKALRDIESRVAFYELIETVFFGLSLGSVLVLAAIGLAITFGVMGVINMAHGELIMLGAYTTYVIQQLLPDQIGWSVLLAIPTAFLVSGLVGILIERGVIRFLYGRPLETLLATFGVSLLLQQTVRSIFSPLNRSVATPSWMSGSLEINSALSLTYNRLYILLFSLLVFALLWLVLNRTTLGIKVRAVSQNRAMARAMGIRANWIDALTFGLGSGIAGVAGVALSQLTNVGPNLGQAYIIDSFMVVVFGGVGNIWGTLVGGLTLGVANKFLEPYSGAVLAKTLVLVFIILFIQRRPRGLFPQKGRAAEG